jgi:hypothetical protein
MSLKEEGGEARSKIKRARREGEEGDDGGNNANDKNIMIASNNKQRQLLKELDPKVLARAAKDDPALLQELKVLKDNLIQSIAAVEKELREENLAAAAEAAAAREQEHQAKIQHLLDANKCFTCEEVSDNLISCAGFKKIKDRVCEGAKFCKNCAEEFPKCQDEECKACLCEDCMATAVECQGCKMLVCIACKERDTALFAKCDECEVCFCCECYDDETKVTRLDCEVCDFTPEKMYCKECDHEVYENCDCCDRIMCGSCRCTTWENGEPYSVCLRCT